MKPHKLMQPPPHAARPHAAQGRATPPARPAHTLTPRGVLQPKTTHGAHAPKIHAPHARDAATPRVPCAPPVYRATPNKTAQPKLAQPLQPKTVQAAGPSSAATPTRVAPQAPPVYRPQAARPHAAQAKMSAAPVAPLRPPTPTPKVSRPTGATTPARAGLPERPRGVGAVQRMAARPAPVQAAGRPSPPSAPRVRGGTIQRSKAKVPFDYEYDSLDEEEKEFAFSSSRSNSKQPGNYETNRHCVKDQGLSFFSSEGLSLAVKEVGFGGDGRYKVNTHALFTHGGESFLARQQTLVGMEAMAANYHVNQILSVEFGAQVHTEMQILHHITDGDKTKIPGCAAGQILTVDKPVCKQCYPYVVSAGFAEVRDGTDFLKVGAAARENFADWKDPF